MQGELDARQAQAESLRAHIQEAEGALDTARAAEAALRREVAREKAAAAEAAASLERERAAVAHVGPKLLVPFGKRHCTGNHVGTAEM